MMGVAIEMLALEAEAWNQPGGVEVDFDLTFVGQMFLFGLLMVLLKPLLFEPLLRLFEERERRIEGAKQQARELDQHSEKLLIQYETALKHGHTQATAEQTQILTSALTGEQKKLEETRAAMIQTLEVERAQLESTAAEVHAALQVQTVGMASALVSQILGRRIQP